MVNDEISFEQCQESCLSCYSACIQIATDLLTKGPAHVSQYQTLMDCAEICHLTANFLLRRSGFHRDLCALCAPFCDRCAEACEQYEGSAEAIKCVLACRRCADSCRKMASQSEKEQPSMEGADRYQDYLSCARELTFIENDNMADSAVKAVLGILTSRLEAKDAQELANHLPFPLTLEKLRSHQINVVHMNYNQYVAAIATQFNTNAGDAECLIGAILGRLKKDLGSALIDQITTSLPQDWAEEMRRFRAA